MIKSKHEINSAKHITLGKLIFKKSRELQIARNNSQGKNRRKREIQERKSTE